MATPVDRHIIPIMFVGFIIKKQVIGDPDETCALFEVHFRFCLANGQPSDRRKAQVKLSPGADLSSKFEVSLPSPEAPDELPYDHHSFSRCAESFVRSQLLKSGIDCPAAASGKVHLDARDELVVTKHEEQMVVLVPCDPGS